MMIERQMVGEVLSLAFLICVCISNGVYRRTLRLQNWLHLTVRLRRSDQRYARIQMVNHVILHPG